MASFLRIYSLIRVPGNNGSASSSFNARAKAQRRKAQEEYDDYWDEDDFYPRFAPRYDPHHHYYHAYHNAYEARYNNHWTRPEPVREPEPEPEHDHSRGTIYCPRCNDSAAKVLDMLEREDEKEMGEYTYLLRRPLYGVRPMIESAIRTLINIPTGHGGRHYIVLFIQLCTRL